jgi:polygalacturonase
MRIGKSLWGITLCTLFLGGCTTNNQPANNSPSAAATDEIYKNLPFDMPKVQQPVFPDYTVNIKDFGAVSDGITLNTEAINKAIKAVNEKGGGKDVIP